MNAELKKKHLKRDNLLILHLTDWCNNRCGFCMIDEVHGPFSFPYDEAVSLVDELPAGSKVDLFGGEPTMHPRFLDLLAHIYSRGLECSVATNGRMFSKKEFFNRVREITGPSVYVRTSLYGLTAAAHDSATGVTGSYDELMRGMDNVVAAGMACQVNIVLTRRNLAELEAITRLVIAGGAGRIKFGLLMGSSASTDIIPTISEVRAGLVKPLGIAREAGLKVTVEKAPLCVAPEYMSEFSSERDLGGWPRYFDDSGECGLCVMRKWCDGLDPEYAAAFGTEGILRIERVSREVLSPFPDAPGPGQVRFLKFNLFALPAQSGAGNGCEEMIKAVIEEAGRKHARVAFVPASLVGGAKNMGPTADDHIKKRRSICR